MSDKTTPPPDASHAVASMISRRFKIPGDTVNAATADLPDDQRSLIRWYHNFCAEHDLSIEDAATKIRYDYTTLYRVFTGKYEGSLDNICEQIQQFRRLDTERSQGRRLGFIETAMSRRIWGVCHASLEFQRMGFIFGETQIGKTESLIRFRDDHNHGSTIYVRMPTGGALSEFMASLARALRISPQQHARSLAERIFRSFDDRMLLIVDEAHQCLIGAGPNGRSVRTLEFIRELFDVTKCGVVICGTNVFRDELERGRFAGILKQCRRRRLAILQLSSTPSSKDLDTFANAYGLGAAASRDLQLQTDMIRDEGLGMWLTLLRMAAKCAAKKSKKMTWTHVHEAYAGLRSLESGD